MNEQKMQEQTRLLDQLKLLLRAAKGSLDGLGQQVDQQAPQLPSSAIQTTWTPSMVPGGALRNHHRAQEGLTRFNPVGSELELVKYTGK